MKTCKECQHWDKDGDCLSFKLSYGYSSELEKDGLAYYDEQVDGAWIITGPDFGCIHWKNKSIVNKTNH